MRLALVRLAALGCLFASGSAKLLKWSPDYEAGLWSPPAETINAALAAVDAAPEPTVAPRAVSSELGVRMSTSTCGYVSGLLTRNLTCGNLAVCGADTTSSFIDCCAVDGDCRVRTVCYDSTDRSLWSTDNGYTKWCGDADFPHCMTHTFNGADYAGYTLLWCNVAQGTRPIYFHALDSATTTTPSSSDAASTTSTSDTSSTSATTSESSAPDSGGSSSSGSSTPVGAIVGGVIGGVAVLALIGFLFWFVYNRTRRSAQNSPHAPQGPGMDGYHPANSPDAYPGATPQMAPAWSQYPQQAGYVPAPYPGSTSPKPYNPYDPGATELSGTTPPHGYAPATELPVDRPYHAPSEMDASAASQPRPGQHYAP